MIALVMMGLGVLAGCSSAGSPATEKVGGASCSCGNEAACKQGQLIELTPTESTASFTVTVTAPGGMNQDYVGFDLDVSAFTTGGTIAISGVVGASGSQASFDLYPACTVFPTSGYPNGTLGGAYNITDGSAWSITPYPFPAGDQLFHFGATGNWDSTPGSTNTVDVTIVVTPD
jgi:hypothetical protein